MIQVNPNLSTSDKMAGFFFFGFMGLLLMFCVLNALDRWSCQHCGTKCFWCKKQWVGLGCGCVTRYGKVGRSLIIQPETEAWAKLDLIKQLYSRARFYHEQFLKDRRSGRVANSWVWMARRDAYLTAMWDVKEYRRRHGNPA